MEVILLKDIRKLGRLGDKVKVKSGYGRNYLIPQSLALPANDANIKYFEERKEELERQAKEELAQAESRKEKLETLKLILSVKSGDEGKLFGSVGNRDIAEAAKKAGCEISKNEVKLPDGPIRNIGDYQVEILLHSEVTAVLNVTLQPIE